MPSSGTTTSSSRLDSHVGLWGKSAEYGGLEEPYPLLGHLLDTAAAARVLCDAWIPQRMRNALAQAGRCSWDQWVSETVLLAGLHDIGKADCHFQNLAPEDCARWLRGMKSKDPRHGSQGRRDKRHAYNSALFVWDAAESWGVCDETRLRAGQIVGGHHGVVPTYNTRLDRRSGADLVDPVANSDNTCDEAVQRLRSARAQLIDTVGCVASGALADNDVLVPSAAVSLAVIAVSDWLVSQRWFLQGQTGQLGGTVQDPAAWIATAETKVRCEVLPQSGLSRPAARSVSASDVIPAVATASGLQLSIESEHPETASGITFIKAPTGDGKTEAALIAASKYARAADSNGWFFAFADQRHSRRAL